MSLRVTSAFFVAALLRRANDAGAFAVVRRRGAEEAGAVHVVVDDRSGLVSLYAPAVAGLGRDEAPSGGDARRFTLALRGTEAEANARLGSEARFDPDFWVVEIEDRDGRSFLDDAIVAD